LLKIQLSQNTGNREAIACKHVEAQLNKNSNDKKPFYTLPMQFYFLN